MRVRDNVVRCLRLVEQIWVGEGFDGPAGPVGHRLVPPGVAKCQESFPPHLDHFQGGVWPHLLPVVQELDPLHAPLLHAEQIIATEMETPSEAANAHRTVAEASLLAHAAEVKDALYTMAIPGDGNCLFRAAAAQTQEYHEHPLQQLYVGL